MAVNWHKLKNEYITTTISQRKLAEKHDVPYNTIRDRSIKEKWVEARAKFRSRSQDMTEQKLVEKIAEKQAQEAMDGLTFLDDLLKDLAEQRKMIVELQKSIQVDSPEKTIIQDTDNQRRIIKDASGLTKIEKSVNSMNRLIDSTKDILEAKLRYAPPKEDEYEDDGLLKALSETLGDWSDDSDFLGDES